MTDQEYEEYRRIQDAYRLLANYGNAPRGNPDFELRKEIFDNLAKRQALE